MSAAVVNAALSARDVLVVELVGKFRQMTSGQIKASLFATLASNTPLDRTLKRLVAHSYLMRLHRLVGGTRGGSAQYVYQLGRQGWKLLGRHGEYWAPRAVNLHSLAVADCMVALKLTEKTDAMEMVRFIAEPECHERVGDVGLTPDAFVEIDINGEKLVSWLEVDRGTEHLDKIQEKCKRYWKASISGQWDGYFPYVLFVVPDKQRAQAIEKLIASGPQGMLEIFSVCTMSDFPKLD